MPWQRSFSPRARTLPLAVLAATLFAALLFAAPAHAGTVTSWYGIQPTGAVGTNVPVIISGGATTDGFLMDASTIKLFIDGALYPKDRYYASSRSGTGLYLSCAPTPALTDGTHTFRVEISDTAGKLSAYQWSALVRQAPTATWVSPAAGSSYYGGLPPITMNIADNTPGAHLSVAGQVRTTSATGAVVSTFGGTGLASGVHTFSLPAELAPGTYYLTATATDASGYARALTGKLARSFKTVSLPAMTRSPQSCLSAGCHVTTGHPTTGRTCLACHVTGYHEDYECNECHAPHTAPVTVTGTFGPCTACHNPSFPGVPGHTPTNVTPAHMSSCGGCHTESLLDRHALTPEGSAYPYQCDLCHASTDPDVVAAIAEGDASCGACHVGHVEEHETTIPAGCAGAGCHSGTNLMPIHANDCAACHESPRQAVTDAIVAGNRACETCHATERVDYHLNMAAAHRAPVSDYETCSGCHHNWGSSSLQGQDILLHRVGCVTCHDGVRDLTDTTAHCANCHTTEGAGTPPEGYHVQTATYHTATGAASLECARCHGSNVRELHVVTTDCSTCHQGMCSNCHAPHNMGGNPALGVGVECARCHTTAGTDFHAGFDAAHTDGAMEAGCQQAECHSSTLVDAHAPFIGTGNRYPQYVDTCALCHLNDDPLRVPDAATAACSSCHADADHEEFHTVTPPADCAGCHPDGSLTTLHVPVGCDACHQSANPDVIAAIASGDRDCSACHEIQPHSGIDSAHTGVMTSAPMTVFDYHEGSSVVWDLPCSLCHGTTELLPIHGNDCSGCHAGTNPAGSFADWSGSCSQGACHPTITHPSPDAAHNSYDCEAACHEPNWDVYYGSCDWCHEPIATLAPFTTSNAVPAYVGTAVISLSTPGTTTSYYRLDGAASVAGKSITVQGPDAGSVEHTLEYWSVSSAGVEEAPHRRVTFTIAADTTPPVTTANAVSAYQGPATILLSVTDDNSVPVTQTFWRLDGGVVTAGRTVNVPQPASGTEDHSLEFWSVDPSGNEELPHNVVAFAVTADKTAPLGSITINAGAAFTASQGVNLTMSAADTGGSGIVDMRLSNNGSTWNAWEPYATYRAYWSMGTTNGARTVWVQFRDRAGNVGTYTDTIVLDSVAPTGSVLINNGDVSTALSGVQLTLSATDTLSGVATMRFSNGSLWSAWEPYATAKTWTLAPGLGARTVSVQFADAAGNQRQVTDTITVVADTTPPTGSVEIDGGAVTTASAAVTLGLSAADTGGAGMASMQFSNDGATWSEWEPYGPSRTWFLAAGDGEKTVSVRFRDAAGNVSPVYSDAITLVTDDVEPPSGSVVIAGDAPETTTSAVTLSLSASDGGGSGMAEMRLSNDGSTWSAWEPYAASRSWTLVPGTGLRTVSVEFRDGAGNVSATATDDIMLAESGVATLAFVWHPSEWSEARLRVLDSVGTVLADQQVSGYGADLDLNVQVQAGRDYYMECLYYYDGAWGDEGGPYGVWVSALATNPDGILSSDETVVWQY